MWTRIDIAILVIGDETDHPVLTAEIVTPAGTLKFMAEPQWSGGFLTLRGLHVHGEDVTANAFGATRLRWLAQAAMEELELDGILVEGEVRTSGAGRGHRPRPLRFTRKLRPER